MEKLVKKGYLAPVTQHNKIKDIVYSRCIALSIEHTISYTITTLCFRFMK